MFNRLTFLVRRSCIIKLVMRSLATYENAIVSLNALQSNASVLEQLKKQRTEHPEENLNQVAKFLQRTGLKVNDLNSLNAIHVTGTKGKGSTCALTESILRRRGLKTGFFSSPHLVHVRERIRINGEPLTEEKFASYFWLVYDRLVATQTAEDSSMPAYFKFLTIMAFHVFLAEKVDVAVVEVGIGGTYDCTNVIPKPVACAITTIDFDHMKILGDTLEQIAWQKSGIMKENAAAVCADQPSGVLSVLAKRSVELKCPLFIAPLLAEFQSNGCDSFKVGIPGVQQLENASVALVLSRLWLQRMSGNKTYLPPSSSVRFVHDLKTNVELNIPVVNPFELTVYEREGLQTCKWPGRCQILRTERITYFLDGAHTPKSMELCASWFKEAVAEEMETKNKKSDVMKILIFNCTSDRNPATLLPYLLDCNFDGAIFCPGMVDIKVKINSDLAKLNLSHEQAVARSEENRKAYLKLLSKRDELTTTTTLAVNRNGCTKTNVVMEDNSDLLIVTSPCISSSMRWLEGLTTSQPNARLAVLVTGSLHLVGGVLSVIDPDLKL